MYLDSSALFKRYIEESGSTSLDHLFSRAESQQLRLVFSAWNVGEVIGALDERHQQKRLTDGEFSTALLNFSEETLRMVRVGSTRILPVAGKILTASWQILQREHIYEADALQIASCKEETCELFVTGDRRLLQAAHAQGVTGLDPVKDERKLISL